MSNHTKGKLEYTVLANTEIPATLFIKDNHHPDVDIAVFEKWENDWAKKEMVANAKELRRRWNAFEENYSVNLVARAIETKQQRDALREFARNFFEWHANHFEDFSTEINAQLLSLANTAEPLITQNEKQA